MREEVVQVLGGVKRSVQQVEMATRWQWLVVTFLVVFI